jgi:molybdopterin molybdotransferase
VHTVEDAVRRIVSGIAPLPVERVALLDALGRVLATPVASPLTLPSWDNSAMDGYALRAQDVEGASEGAPVTLTVLETVAAGDFPTLEVVAGSCSRIMTGAPLPKGADTVIRLEDTDGGLERVAVRDARDSLRNVRFRGEDINAGAVVLQRGQPIGAAQIGVLASVGASSVDVYRQPRVAFFGSGDEVVDLDRFTEALDGKKIVTSNSYTLHALIRATGGIPVNFGVARDDPDDLRDRLARAAGCDLLVTSGGISAGERDFLRPVLAEAGLTMDVWRVRMRPGAPLGFGRLGGMPWVGLPGNPVSTMVTFDLFVRPVIRRMLGHTRLYRRTVTVTLEEPVTIAAKLTHFLRAIVTVREDHSLSARLTGPQGSGILTSMALANALIIVPEERKRIEAGETAHAFLISDDAQLAEDFSL